MIAIIIIGLILIACGLFIPTVMAKSLSKAEYEQDTVRFPPDSIL